MSDSLSDLAREVQHHVPEQPWGQNGNSPVPVELWYNHDPDYPGRPGWHARFVIGLRRGRRHWETASGETIEACLRAARTAQEAEAQRTSLLGILTADDRPVSP